MRLDILSVLFIGHVLIRSSPFPVLFSYQTCGIDYTVRQKLPESLTQWLSWLSVDWSLLFQSLDQGKHPSWAQVHPKWSIHLWRWLCTSKQSRGRNTVHIWSKPSPSGISGCHLDLAGEWEVMGVISHTFAFSCTATPAALPAQQHCQHFGCVAGDPALGGKQNGLVVSHSQDLHWGLPTPADILTIISHQLKKVQPGL